MKHNTSLIGRSAGLALAVCGLASMTNASQAQSVTEGAAASRLRETAATRPWVWRVGADDRPLFRGVVSYDNAGGGTAAMMYPAPNVAGLLVAILTHAALNEGVKSAEAKRLTTAADAVLTPFQASIDQLSMRDIQELALRELRVGSTRQLVAREEAVDDGWVVETQPIFFMTQDRRALVVESLVRLYDGGAGKPSIERVVRVVSSGVEAEDADAHWRDENGAKLRSTSAALLAEAIRVTLLDVQTPGELPQRTVRYREGSMDKIERGMPLEEPCSRVAVRTLRGGVLSAPTRTKDSISGSSDSPECGGGSARPPA